MTWTTDGPPEERIYLYSMHMLYNAVPDQNGHPPHIPKSHPQQLATPTPYVRRSKQKTLITPSPKTKPLASTISCMSPFLPREARLVWKMYSIIPPTRRASEKDGVLRNPIANATPEGIHLAYHNPRLEACVLNAEIRANTTAEESMKIALFSGRLPLPLRPVNKNRKS